MATGNIQGDTAQTMAQLATAIHKNDAKDITNGVAELGAELAAIA
jgi:hypothetical protein